MYKTAVTDFIYAMENEHHEFLSELKKHVSTNVGDEESYAQLSKLLAGIVKSNTEFGHVEILFEYKPPCYSGYSDVILLGKKNGVPCAYVIELKNWSKDRVCQCYIGRKKRNGEYPISYNNAPCDHPSTQVKGYVTALEKTHSAVVKPNGYETPQVRGVVFFTNPDFDDSSLESYRNKPFDQLTKDYPVFNCQSASLQALAMDIQEHLAEGDEAFKEKFLQGTYTQSYELQQFVCHAIQSYLSDGTAEKPFVLSEKQEEAFVALFDALKKALEDPNKKQVFVVKGLPGTGKTAVAVNLLVEALKLADRHRKLGNVVFTSATTNAKTWENIFNSDEKVLISTKEFNPGINGSNNAQAIKLFEDAKLGHLIETDRKGKKSFKLDRWRDVWAALRDGKVDTGRPKLTENMHSLTIVDEAHSLIYPYYDKDDDEGDGQVKYSRLGNWFSKVGPQAYYIIYTSRVSDFFMENAQGFQDRETTTVDIIKKLAEELKVPFDDHFELTEQFRCGHSTEYVEWIDRLFSDSSIANHASWKNKFTFEVFDFPNQMENCLRRHMEGEGGNRPSGRLLSSYSVKWITKEKANKHELPPDKLDFQLPNDDGTNWSRLWNIPGEFVSPLTNAAMLDDPLCEVGYPQEIRGWDFSFFGILWLDDVVWRNGRWQVHLPSIVFDDGIASQRKAVVERFKQWGYAGAKVDKLHWSKRTFMTLSTDARSIAEKKHNLLGDSPEYIWMGLSNETDKLCVTMFRIYRILLTRAIVGNFVYIKDKETREHVRGLLK
ncbi:MAG: DUF2075 domain-containing protein [Victivallales bacterium]|nr:DUF2075 domain-containing protein [Victivallales bacterium]